MRRAGGSALLLGVLCLTCAAFAAIAIASSAAVHATRHRHAHAVPVCHRRRHHRCPPTKKLSHAKHKPSGGSKPSTSSSSSTGSGAAPAPAGSASSGAAGSPPGSGTLPSTPAGEAPPVEAPKAPNVSHLEVTAEDSEAFRFVLSRPSVPAGKVIIEFVNHGQDEHNLNAIEPAAGTVAGSLPDTAPNAHPSLTLTLKPGSYTLFCSLPDHEAKGMKATLVVN